MSSSPVRVGNYVVHGVIDGGGMATVHFGRMIGDAGFTRTVAVKRLHAHLANDAKFVCQLLDEAHLVARIKHLNVVVTHDVVQTDHEVMLVMEYVPGESLSRLLACVRRDRVRIDPAIASAVMIGVLRGLHAAHEATKETGEPLHIVHRDVSPQNILVGTDGIARVLDFGVAKAVGRLQTTHDGQLKGKLGYMAPEQLRGERVDRRADVFAAGTVLWEMLTGEHLFHASNEGQTVERLVQGAIRRPSEVAEGIDPAVEEVVMRALDRAPTHRFATAQRMAAALEAAVRPATPAQVEAWVRDLASEALRRREAMVAEIERLSANEPSASETAPDAGELADAAAVVAPAPSPSVEVRGDSASADRPRRRRAAIAAAAVVVFLGVSAFVLSTALRRNVRSTATNAAAAAAETDAAAGDTVPPSIASAASAAALTPPALDQDAGRSPARVAPNAQTAASHRRWVKGTHSAAGAHATTGTSGTSGTKTTHDGVTEYVGPDGVTYFCREPNCPH